MTTLQTEKSEECKHKNFTPNVLGSHTCKFCDDCGVFFEIDDCWKCHGKNVQRDIRTKPCSHGWKGGKYVCPDGCNPNDKTKSTLETIIYWYERGYSATLVFKGSIYGQVVLIDNYTGTICVRTDNNALKQKLFHKIEDNTSDEYEITGFLFMGELGGNKEIEEGAKFRVKNAIWRKGQIGKFQHINILKTVTLDFDGSKEEFTKSEIEPVIT